MNNDHKLKIAINGSAALLAGPWLWALLSSMMPTDEFKLALGMTCALISFVGVMYAIHPFMPG